ncbi:hypothetical protein Vafri_17933, partial [Volvox africanus]
LEVSERRPEPSAAAAPAMAATLPTQIVRLRCRVLTEAPPLLQCRYLFRWTRAEWCRLPSVDADGEDALTARYSCGCSELPIRVGVPGPQLCVGRVVYRTVVVGS